MNHFTLAILLLISCFPAAQASIHNAIKKGNIAKVASLIKKGEDVNLRYGYNQEAPLHVAVLKGNTEIVKLLINKKPQINLNPQDSLGNTPLFLAIDKNYMEIAQLLIDAGANVNLSNLSGWTPLYAAVFNKLVDTMRFLVEYGKADVNVKAIDGLTSLHTAARQGPKEMVEHLINYGASINAQSNSGSTPLDEAHDPQIIDLLIRNEAKRKSEL